MPKRPSEEYNLLTEHPEVAAQWHPRLNNGLKPTQVTPKSRKTAWWLCPKGADHEWETIISSRTSTMKSNCPFCANQRPSVTNNLQLKYPDLCIDWDYDLNDGKSPKDYLPKSKIKVYWHCNNGHESFLATIADRTLKGSGCPKCSGNEVSDSSRLDKHNPDLLCEWDYSKNTSIKPNLVSYGSNKRVWWLCKNGHSWPATISSRATRGTGCPHCSHQTSKPEIRLFAELKSIFDDALHRHRFDRFELDVFLPTLKLGVEYDGYYFHSKSKERNSRKLNFFSSRGIVVFRVRESGLGRLSALDIEVSENSVIEHADISKLLTLMRSHLPPHQKRLVDAYINNRKLQGNETYRRILKYLPNPLPEDSLQSTHPSLSNEWHPTKNAPLRPENFTSGSKEKVYWMCINCQSAYPAQINNRAKKIRPTACPFCTGKSVNETNSLEAYSGEISQLWDSKLNAPLKPGDVTRFSKKVVHWKCGSGHAWRLSVKQQAKRLPPYCKACKLSAHSLQTQYPEVAKTWHATKNSPIKPSDVTYGSNKVYWWTCRCGLDYPLSVKKRVRKNKACDACK